MRGPHRRRTLHRGRGRRPCVVPGSRTNCPVVTSGDRDDQSVALFGGQTVVADGQIAERAHTEIVQLAANPVMRVVALVNCPSHAAPPMTGRAPEDVQRRRDR